MTQKKRFARVIFWDNSQKDYPINKKVTEEEVKDYFPIDKILKIDGKIKKIKKVKIIDSLSKSESLSKSDRTPP